MRNCEFLPWCGCWIWMGAHSPQGYGVIRTAGKVMRVHRLAYSLFIGPVTQEQHVAHKHSCAARDCINPEHLMQLTRDEHTRYDFKWPLHNRNTFAIGSQRGSY